MAPSTVDRPAKPGVAAASGKADVGLVLSKEDLFAPRPARYQEYKMPGLGLVRMASLLGDHQQEINDRHEKDGKLRASVQYMAEVVAACLVDVNGKRMFDDIRSGAKRVMQLDLGEIIELFTHAATASAMSLEAREALGKGSEATPADDD